MHITIIYENRSPISLELPYSIGDIVRIKSPRSCLTNYAIDTFFKIDKPLYYDKNINDEIFLGDYPELKDDCNEWKVVDVKKIPFATSLAVLLVNRSKQYIVMSQPMRRTHSINYDILKLIRKGKKTKEKITLNNERIY